MTSRVLASAAVVGLLALGAAFAADETPPATEPPKAEAPPATPDFAKDSESCRKALVARKLSLDLKGVPLQDALEMLAASAGVGLMVDGHIEAGKLSEPVDLKLERASVYAVLHWMFLARDLHWAVRGKDVLVAPLQFIDPDVATRQGEFVDATEDAWAAAVRPKFASVKLTVDVSGVPADGLAQLVAERAGVGVVWAGDAAKRRDRAVEFKLENASLSKILDKLSASADVDWGLEAEAIVFSPK